MIYLDLYHAFYAISFFSGHSTALMSTGCCPSVSQACKPKSESCTNLEEAVQKHYGETLKSGADLKTNACTASAKPHPIICAAMSNVPLPIMERFFGCGSPIPVNLEGLSILDLGCGAGRDCYIAAQLAGKDGQVTGVDMTPSQLEFARRYVDEFTKEQGFPKPTMNFIEGNIESLLACGIPRDSVDVVISNCVINLCTNKAGVLQQVYSVLRNGGEFYFSDMYCDRRLNPELKGDPLLHAEGLTGALYEHDFVAMAKAAGFGEVRVLTRAPLTIKDAAIQERLGNAKYYAVTYRLFKVAGLEPRCEDYGQVAVYNGTINGHAHKYELDEGHVFETGRPMLICGNTALLLTEGVLCKGHFTVTGDTKTHYGIFPCNKGPLMSVSESSGEASCAPGGGCC